MILGWVKNAVEVAVEAERDAPLSDAEKESLIRYLSETPNGTYLKWKGRVWPTENS